eukprot:SAG31_NODE_243_length_19342_cov_12.906459_1_plen_65_part_10
MAAPYLLQLAGSRTADKLRAGSCGAPEAHPLPPPLPPAVAPVAAAAAPAAPGAQLCSQPNSSGAR